MKFHQIVVLDDIKIFDKIRLKIKNYSDSPIRVYNFDPKDDFETKERIMGADCILVSWRTTINKEVLSAGRDLKFIFVCGTSIGGIDLEACKKKKITVCNVVDYGDEGAVEFIVYQLLSLVRGFGRYKWKSFPAELNGKILGIIGLGAVGKLLAETALGFKMKVLYNSKSRKIEMEKRGCRFVKKQELLQKSDIISLQTPRDVRILGKEDFGLMKGKILVNTTLGKAFKEKDFKDWIKRPNNFAIMDESTSPDFYKEFHNLERVIFPKIYAGRTGESLTRLSEKVLYNISACLAGKPINKVS